MSEVHPDMLVDIECTSCYSNPHREGPPHETEPPYDTTAVEITSGYNLTEAEYLHFDNDPNLITTDDWIAAFRSIGFVILRASEVGRLRGIERSMREHVVELSDLKGAYRHSGLSVGSALDHVAASIMDDIGMTSDELLDELGKI
jgi:hypothetical protein